MKPKVGGFISSPAKGGGGGGGGEWEVRPGGMLVQKRTVDSNQNPAIVPTIKIRVKYGSIYHEVTISSQASFGELKKILAGQTGLNPQDQKLIYKEKERDSKLFLDVAGVKNGSKLVLVEDELSKERRFIESRKTAKMEKASKDIAEIRFQIDNLAKQVAGVELDIHGGKKVTENVILNLIELLMTELIKLDAIDADGDVKLQRRMQVKRVQKYIENLDMLKLKNSGLGNNNSKVQLPTQHHHHHPYTVFTGEMHKQQRPIQNQIKDQKKKQRDYYNEKSPGPVVVTTKWETF